MRMLRGLGRGREMLPSCTAFLRVLKRNTKTNDSSVHEQTPRDVSLQAKQRLHEEAHMTTVMR